MIINSPHEPQTNGYSEEQKDTVHRYWLALQELCDEENETAALIADGLKENKNLMFWTLNIHNNTWPETSFANILKVRVMRNRMKG